MKNLNNGLLTQFNELDGNYDADSIELELNEFEKEDAIISKMKTKKPEFIANGKFFFTIEEVEAYAKSLNLRISNIERVIYMQVVSLNS